MANAKQNNHFRTQRLTVSALMMALSAFIAIICAHIPAFNFSFGGGITIGSMLPIVIIAYMYGTKWGLFTSFVYAVFQMILGSNTISALFLPNSDSHTTLINALLICLIDYVLAYTCLGLGGIFRNIQNRKGEHSAIKALVLGTLVALSLRYLCHIVSGAIFYGSFAEWFFGDTVVAELAISKTILETFSGASLALIYSVVYNGCYMIPEIIISVLAALGVSRLPMIKKQ